MAMLKRAGLLAHSKNVVGSSGTVVSRIASEDAADLIVMGSHGHTGFQSLLFGSVTQAVLASCGMPLLVLRSDAVPKHDSLKVGIALDGSKYGLAAVRFVVKHSALFGAAPTLTLIHVVPDLLNLRVPGFLADAPVPGIKPQQLQEMQRAGFERALAPARKLRLTPTHDRPLQISWRTDASRNRSASNPISDSASRCQVLVLASQEDEQIARHTWAALV